MTQVQHQLRDLLDCVVVGAGPAGLEAARALGQRGYEVHLAEARKELGGRVTREARPDGGCVLRSRDQIPDRSENVRRDARALAVR